MPVVQTRHQLDAAVKIGAKPEQIFQVARQAAQRAERFPRVKSNLSDKQPLDADEDGAQNLMACGPGHYRLLTGNKNVVLDMPSEAVAP